MDSHAVPTHNQLSASEKYIRSVQHQDMRKIFESPRNLIFMDTDKALCIVALDAAAEARHQELRDIVSRLDPDALDAYTRRAAESAQSMDAVLQQARTQSRELAAIVATTRELSGSVAPVLDELQGLRADNARLLETLHAERAQMHNALRDATSAMQAARAAYQPTPAARCSVQ